MKTEMRMATATALYRKLILMLLVWSLLVVVSAPCMAVDVVLQWDPNSEPDLAGYKVYYTPAATFDGNGAVMAAQVTGTTATVASLDPSYSYSFAVTAYNQSGTESGYSNTVTVNELLAPSVAVSYPPSNASVSGTVSVTATASDNVGVTRVEFYLDNVLQTADTTTPYLYSWDTASAPVGNHVLVAKAYDAAGNIGQSSSIAVSVVNDTTSPTIAVTAPAASSTVTGTVTVTATASDDVGVSRVEFYQNGVMRAAVNTTPYTYNWDTRTEANGSYTLYAKAFDAAGNSSQSTSVTVGVNNVVADTTAPVISVFTMPTSSSSLTVAVSSLNATDATGVTGYLISESSAAPSASASGWSTTVPSSFTFSSEGTRTAYAWAKDAAGNVSSGVSKSVSIALPDTSAPVVSAFIMPTTSTSLTVTVSSLAATDAKGVTGYLISESSATPSASASGWSTTVPSSFTFSSEGTRTAYAWAKDAAGNVSSGVSKSVSIALPDTSAPVVSAFTMPTTSTSLTVTVSSLAATDAKGVTGYLISESSATPSASASGWTSTKPSSFTFSGEGNRTAYAWAKDAAGNVSAPRSAAVVVTLPVTPAPDTTAPVVGLNQVASPTTATSQVLGGSVTDNVGVASVTVQVGSATPNAATVSGSTWSYNLSGLPVGTSLITVRATDAAGNSSMAQASIVVENPPQPLSIADATLAMQISVGKIQVSNDQKTRLDIAPVVNGKSSPNGKVDTGDAIVILSKVVGKISL